MTAQCVVAVALPWLVGRVLLPGEVLWGLAAVTAVTAFAVLHRRHAVVWLLPASALVSVVPAVPLGVAAVAAIATLVVLLARPPAPQTDGTAPRALAAALLVTAGVLVGTSALLAVRDSNADFEAGQEAAAEAWDAPLIGSTASDAPAAVATRPADPPPTRAPGAPGSSPALAGPDGSAAATPGDPVFAPEPLAQLAFRRPGSTSQPVTDRVLYVGPDVSEASLTRGPGHYPSTARPGADGNFAVAGHRTGWGAPFYLLDELRPGDEVLVTDRLGARHVYAVDRAEIVGPDDTWVLAADPLGTDLPTLTLTTCDPPGINDRRLVVFATLTG